jgi:heptosyltransferase-2
LKRILVIRGGAIGDFILTLPALKALREHYSKSHIEVLGYKHIVALADNRFYADATRSIEYGPLSSFFARGAELSPELRDYFAGFGLVISYLFDPDEIFATNLRASGVKALLIGPAKITDRGNAARQLVRPIQELGIDVADFVPRIFPSSQDRQFADEFLCDPPSPIVAIHPGSGSEKKNWPLENWIQLGNDLLDSSYSLLVVGGEADAAQIATLKATWKDQPVQFVANLPLPQLAAILEKAVFIGHDSGISHLAAAVGARCILVFGPTDPAIWAPTNDNVRVLRATSGRMEDVDLASVIKGLKDPIEN